MSDKVTSRKFIVWIAATVFFVGGLIYAFVAKDQALALEFVPWWGGISMVYIGGNVAQKFAPTEPETPAETDGKDES